MRNFEALISELEQVELESTNGITNAQTYAQLLALYLYKNETCYAKYLWKRIPPNIKSSHPELQLIWTVGQKMWLRDWEGVHAALRAEWSNNVSDIMNALKERNRERAISLISEAYSSLDIKTLAKMTGTTKDEAKLLATENGWETSNSTVKPCKMQKQPFSTVNESTTEDQLHKLTQFVSFLEN